MPRRTDGLDTDDTSEGNPADPTSSDAQTGVDPLEAASTDIERDAWITRGHEIITQELGRAREMAPHYPVINALLPRIESMLHALFSHMVSTEPDPIPPAES